MNSLNVIVEACSTCFFRLRALSLAASPRAPTTYSQPSARLAHLELEQLDACEVHVPARVLDLERRAILARKQVGGIACCLNCPALLRQNQNAAPRLPALIGEDHASTDVKT